MVSKSLVRPHPKKLYRQTLRHNQKIPEYRIWEYHLVVLRIHLSCTYNHPIWNIIITISLLGWRTTARVIRSQVLSIKERPYITAAKVSGASNLRIMYIHILPNVLPMSFLYIALGIAWATLSEASLSFLGLGDPRMISWGQMLYYAFLTGSARSSWWNVLPPGLCIALFVISAFMVGQAYEEVVNPRLRARR